MKHYSDLSESEKKQLLKLPAYMSLLTSTTEAGIDKEEKDTAVKITHVKAYSSDPILVDFYKEAESVFEKTITDLDAKLPHNREERKIAIQLELNKLESLLSKLDPDFVSALRRSIRSYDYYISKAHQNVMEYFIFPMPIDGISD